MGLVRRLEDWILWRDCIDAAMATPSILTNCRTKSGSQLFGFGFVDNRQRTTSYCSTPGGKYLFLIGEGKFANREMGNLIYRRHRRDSSCSFTFTSTHHSADLSSLDIVHSHPSSFLLIFEYKQTSNLGCSSSGGPSQSNPF